MSYRFPSTRTAETKLAPAAGVLARVRCLGPSSSLLGEVTVRCLREEIWPSFPKGKRSQTSSLLWANCTLRSCAEVLTLSTSFGNRVTADVSSSDGVGWGPNAAWLLPLWKGDIRTQTHTGRKDAVWKPRQTQSGMSTSQGTPQIASKPPDAMTAAWNRILPPSSRKEPTLPRPWPQPTSLHNSEITKLCCWRPHSVPLCYGSPRERRQPLTQQGEYVLRVCTLAKAWVVGALPCSTAYNS